MKKIINGKVYDTKTARLIGENNSKDAFKIEKEILYLSTKGQYFIYETRAFKEEAYIRLIEESKAREWAEKNVPAERYLEFFEAEIG